MKCCNSKIFNRESIATTPYRSLNKFPVCDQKLLLADKTDIEGICKQIATATLLGMRRPATADTAALLTVLPVIMLQKLREYDLVLGSNLLRTIKYLGVAKSIEASYAIEYLQTQQHSDGRFGYYARELRELQDLVNPELHLYLPVTVSVVWAIVEALTPNFTLMPTRTRR